MLIDQLRAHFGEQVQTDVPLAPYTSARIGGPADILLTVQSAEELAQAASLLWQAGQSFYLMGGGSNLLVGDAGVRGVVVLNRAKDSHFAEGENPTVWVESGVVLANLARRAATYGLAGLEWGASVPGTIGGAIYGNAGAHGGDMAGNLLEAEVLTKSGERVSLNSQQMGYAYRTSILKRHELDAIVLSATLALKNSERATVQATMDEFVAHRKATQPPGASMGSMFKNPPGDYAGRLIEAAGLKGTRIGNAEISPVHANFFINHGETRSADVRQLVHLAQSTVAQKFNIHLELEVEFLGEDQP
jgi:UDP-N-acetylmuramate dehydrogenase